MWVDTAVKVVDELVFVQRVTFFRSEEQTEVEGAPQLVHDDLHSDVRAYHATYLRTLQRLASDPAAGADEALCEGP